MTPPTTPESTAQAVEEALQRHERGLVLAAVRLLGDLERARDVVQESFLRLLRHPEVLADPDPETTARWLYTVCRNQALDVLRKERRMTPLSEERERLEPAGEPGPDSRLEAADSAAKALDLMERLPGKQAEAVRLKFEHGLSYQEISRRIDVSVGQVGWLLHMALKALRTELSGDGDAAVEQGARA